MNAVAMPHAIVLPDLARLVAEKFGLELSRYSRTSVDILLAALDRVSPEDAEARIRLLISTFSIGETCFMRHAEQLEALGKLVRSIPAMRRGERLRVWSAGCATGEEVYSLLAVLSRELGDYPLDLVGTDVNPQFILRAQKGSYRPWSLRGVDLEEVAHFLQLSSEGAQVVPSFIERVQFREQNLMHDDFASGQHVVSCRNVLMYFQPAAAQAVLKRMAHAVEPGGLLFLGYSDPAPAADGLWVKEELQGVRYFRRAFHPSLGAVSPAPRREESPARIGEDRQHARAAARPLPEPKEPPSALCLLEDLASDSLFDVDTHVLAAVLADEAGEHTRALTAARQASFLAPDAAFPHFLLARAFGALGETRREGAHVALARRCLLRAPDTQVPLDHAQGLTALQLARMIDAAYG